MCILIFFECLEDCLRLFKVIFSRLNFWSLLRWRKGSGTIFCTSLFWTWDYFGPGTIFCTGNILKPVLFCNWDYFERDYFGRDYFRPRTILNPVLFWAGLFWTGLFSNPAVKYFMFPILALSSTSHAYDSLKAGNELKISLKF